MIEKILWAILLVVAINAVLILWNLLRATPAGKANPEILDRLGFLKDHVGQLPDIQRKEAQVVREEITGSLVTNFGSQQQVLGNQFESLTRTQAEQLAAMRQEASDGREKLEKALKDSTDQFAQTQSTRLSQTNEEMKALAAKLDEALKVAREAQEKSLLQVEARITGLTEANEKKLESIRESVSGKLDVLRTENDAKLEQMRATVEEKLQGTLEKRLGESFQLVTNQLEQVHKGLGEMASLATGVGDLKRVLTNVKSRGSWGELQLGRLLEDMMPEHFVANVKIRPDRAEVVEFAVRLPGKESDKPIFLPIDAKFPQEDYERLVLAQDSGVAEEVEKAGLALERAIRLQAKTISDKYVHPPHSTDFAIMYLPTEGLFAEAIRRPGLSSELQNNHRVMIAGPTTLAALLNSLQMGFRTLAIEQRSSEVWQVLGAAKAEFKKYGDVWDKLAKQLETAQNTVSSAGQRTRMIERKLRTVETLEVPDLVEDLIGLPEPDLGPDDE